MKPSELLKQLQTFPKKRFGQNFLVDERVLHDISDAAELSSEDTIVEIGPGLGVLTRELAQKVSRVIAIEADHDLSGYLKKQKIRGVTVVSGDALRIDWTISIESPYKIVANIPYSLTSPLLKKIYQLTSRPSTVVLMVQKEVADRLMAKPGESERGLMTVLTEAVAVVEKIRTVKPGSFYPAPKVDSAIVRITFKDVDHRSKILWPLVEAGFRHKRQTLANALSQEHLLDKASVESILKDLTVSEKARAEELSLEQWEFLSKKVGL